MRIIKVVFIILLSTLYLNASIKTLKPIDSLKANGGVTDMVINNQKLYVATTNSSIDIFDINTKKRLKQISIPKIKDFMGDTINAKVYSVDVFKDKILILSQGNKGGRNIFIYENEKLHTIISDEKRLFIAKAKFLSKNRILYTLLSNQLFLYDLKNKKIIYERQASQSRFSDFSLNDDKSKIIIADESGVLHEYKTSNGKFVKDYKYQNLDNVYQVDWKKNKIITAGQDRRSVVYNAINKNAYYKEVAFLIYSCALSPSSSLGAFASDELNNVTIFNTLTKTELYKLVGNKMIITNIVFLNEKEVFVSSDDKNINYYKLKN
ncbi:hypothetical protein CP960_00895 [Malaciobacter halophilus]|uniref:Nitrate reductase n=1 Tax=Malaciobacter halophilus TaxID=197482 RepID=A0A2N1J651_9BACT|nr:hypothetical protein [Malaciobacter halophilus]AXH08818.1 nitrate reductase accessory protein [Malaciobacter halophilus]PKI82048.1 hypothetical protein CP960_00895 [Malaciobacter halophilus]